MVLSYINRTPPGYIRKYADWYAGTQKWYASRYAKNKVRTIEKLMGFPARFLLSGKFPVETPYTAQLICELRNSKFLRKSACTPRHHWLFR
nr:MAG TPA: hypothetical protein [Caudoviricetes sp.]